MAQALTMPKLGMTMESGRVLEWKKEEGAQVARGEIILVVETEKVQYEVESPASGFLHILAPVDTEAAPGTILALIAADRAEFESPAADSSPAPAGSSPATEPPPAAVASREKVPVAPAARRLAEEKGIDIRRVQGTGPGGRITKDDVERHERAQAAATEGETRVILIQRTELRRTVARRMIESLHEAAQTNISNDVDATALAEYRQQLLAGAPTTRITITDMLMKLTACALQLHPIINSRYTEEGDWLYRDVHMGMAMSVRENELVVPVIRDIDKKSLAEIAAARLDYLERGRQGKLTMEELGGSTFTLSSLGMLGAHRFVAIINRPENAILAVGAMLQRPWVYEGRIAIRTVMNLTLSYDHRSIYGAEAARFLATLQQFVENPGRILSGS